MRDHCGLHNKIFCTSSPKIKFIHGQQNASESLPAVDYISGESQVGRPLITVQLVVEFPDCKAQTITFKRGWVCFSGGGVGGERAIKLCDMVIMQYTMPLDLSEMTLIHSKTLPHAAVVNQKSLLQESWSHTKSKLGIRHCHPPLKTCQKQGGSISSSLWRFPLSSQQLSLVSLGCCVQDSVRDFHFASYPALPLGS